MRTLVPVVLLAVSACQAPMIESAEKSQSAPATQEEVPAAGPSSSVASLAGEWRVAGIDGRDFDEPYGLALRGDETQLWWAPRCAGMVRDYAIDGGRVRFSTPATLEGSPGRPVCRIGVPPRLAEVITALDGADRIARTPQNGILISGPRHSVTLFSQ